MQAYFKALFICFGLMISFNCMSQHSDTSTHALQQKLIKSQIAYYEKQTQGKSIWELFTPVLPGIIGTLIGASLALFGVRWSSGRQWRLEKDKWEKSQRNEALKEVKQAVANLARVIAAEVQAIVWLTWTAKYQPATLSKKDIDEYYAEIKVLFKEDVVTQTYLSMLDAELYTKMKPVVKQVVGMDHEMSFPIDKFTRSEDRDEAMEAVRELGSFYDRAADFYQQMPGLLGAMMPPNEVSYKS